MAVIVAIVNLVYAEIVVMHRCRVLHMMAATPII